MKEIKYPKTGTGEIDKKILKTGAASAFLSGDRSLVVIKSLQHQLKNQGITPDLYKDVDSLQNLMSKLASEYLNQL